MNHLMIDLETMGNKPNAPIVAIGAVFFEPSTGEIGPQYSATVLLASEMNLGAQQQKPVVLPEIIRHELIDVLTWIERLPVPTKSAAAKAIRLRKAINDIDAANVKWEMKP